MVRIEEITGVILAGGQSLRFGSCKGLALWHGKPLVQHVAEAMTSVFDDMLLSTNTPEQFAFVNLPMVADVFRNMGPLAGIHATLRRTVRPWVFVLGCDMPAVTPDVIVFLCGLAADEFDAVIPWPAAGPQPLCGLYHKTALAAIEQQLQEENARVVDLVRKLTARRVNEHELAKVTGGRSVFANVNRVGDLDELP